MAANDIARFVRNETVLTRSEAAQAGFKTAERELSAIGKALEAMPQTPYRGAIPGSGIYTPEALGQRASSDFMTKVEKRVRDAASNTAAEARAAVRSAGEAIRVRLDTIAATENAGAFSQARSEAMREFVKNLEREGLQNAVMHRWCAYLDERTCQLCASLDGEVAPAGESFRGYEPGAVHARCRCYSIPYSVFDSKRVAA